MPQQMTRSVENLIQPQPMPECADTFVRQVHGLLDGKPKSEAAVNEALAGLDEMFDLIAAGLYSLASMLVGEGEESVRLVETAVTEAEIASCDEPLTARKSSRKVLSAAALRLLAERDPNGLAAPSGLTVVGGCIEDDELDAAGNSGRELMEMLAGPDRERARKWLAGLPMLDRTIFVLRAVAGFTAEETAALLAANGGPKAAGWTREQVREFCRQALCSLASQLLHAANG